MEAARLPDAGPRVAGIVVSLLALGAGWFVAMPVADPLLPEPGIAGLVCFALLLGGSLALAGYGAGLLPMAWAGAGVACILFFPARLVWPFLPVPMALLCCVAWWQARQPRAPAAPFAWQPVPVAYAPPLPPRRP